MNNCKALRLLYTYTCDPLQRVYLDEKYICRKREKVESTKVLFSSMQVTDIKKDNKIGLLL